MQQTIVHLVFGISFGAISLWLMPPRPAQTDLAQFESSDGAFVTAIGIGPTDSTRREIQLCLIDHATGPEKAFFGGIDQHALTRLNGRDQACAPIKTTTRRLVLLQRDDHEFRPVMRLMMPLGQRAGRDISVTWHTNADPLN